MLLPYRAEQILENGMYMYCTKVGVDVFKVFSDICLYRHKFYYIHTSCIPSIILSTISLLALNSVREVAIPICFQSLKYCSRLSLSENSLFSSPETHRDQIISMFV